MKAFKKLSYKISVCIIFLFCFFSVKAQDATWEWAKGYGSTSHEQITKILSDSEGNTYFNGYTTSDTLQLGTFLITRNISIDYTKLNFFVKLDKNGNIVWVKSWQSFNPYSDFLIKQDGHIYLVGNYAGNRYFSNDFPLDVSSNTSSDSYKLKIELLPTGELVNYYSEAYMSTRVQISDIYSNSYYQYGKIATSLTLGSFVLQGTTGKTYIAKYNLDHQVLWAINFGVDLMSIQKIVSNPEGEVFVFGEFTEDTLRIGNLSVTNANIGTGIISTDLYIAKFSALGEVEWLYSFGDENHDNAGSMAVDSQGNMTVAGSFHGASLNVNGTILEGTGSCATSYIITFDNNFTILKNVSYTSSYSNAAYDIAYDGLHHYVLGRVLGTLTLDNVTYGTNTTNSAFILKLDSNLAIDTSYWVVDIKNALFNGLSYDNSNNFYIYGGTNEPELTFGPHTLSSNPPNYDIFIAKLHLGEYAGLESEKERGSEALVWPNPNSGTFTIELNKQIELQELKLLDELGRTVQLLDAKSKSFQLNLPKGMYFLEFTSDKQQFLEKMVVF